MKIPAPRSPGRSSAQAPPPKATNSRAHHAKVAILAASATFATARLVDVALIGSGVAAAAGSVAFAGFMYMQGDHAPRVNGMQYLAIFAQPRGAPKASAESGDLASGQTGIDLSPVGAIVVPAATAASDYKLVSARPDRAWVRAGARIFPVHPGDELPNLGRVSAILWSEDHWMLVGDDGQPMLVSGDGVHASNPKATFAKPLILDGGEAQ